MSVAILKEISSAEEQAEQIEALAMQKAKDIVASARKEAAEMVAKAIEQAGKEADNIIKASEEKAFQDINNIKAQIKAQCDEIRENAEKKLDIAVDLIAGRIVKL